GATGAASRPYDRRRTGTRRLTASLDGQCGDVGNGVAPTCSTAMASHLAAAVSLVYRSIVRTVPRSSQLVGVSVLAVARVCTTGDSPVEPIPPGHNGDCEYLFEKCRWEPLSWN